MSAGALLAIAVVAIAILLVLVINIKMSAFVGLLLVAFGTGLAAGIPLGEIVGVMTDGMGKTLGSVMIIVGLGAMLGRQIEVAGGAESLATYFTEKLGKKRTIAAVTMAAFIVGIPIFFDVGFIILAPIIFGFAKVVGVNPLRFGLPVAGVMLTVHVVLPPHPGPVAAAGILGISAGTMILVGLPLAAITGVIGYFFAKKIPVDKIEMLESPATEALERDTDSKTLTKAPHALVIVALILLPILQIAAGTTGGMFAKEGSGLHSFLTAFGSAPIALLIAVLVAYLVIGGQQKWSLEQRGSILDSALPAVAVIVFVTGAGGVFANVLVESGIGKALSDALIATHMPIIVAAFLISATLRASQGSATVAILTTAGLLAEPIAAAGYTPLQSVLVTIALCFGALGFSHINDSGFWIVTKYLGMSVKDGLKSWTLLSTIFGITGFLLTWATFGVVSLAV